MLIEHKKDITFCTFCPKLCGFSCPVAQETASETYTPSGKMGLLYLTSGGVLSDSDISDVIFYGCTLCMVCKNYCKWKIDIPEVIRDAREEFISKNIFPESVSHILKNILSFKNPFKENLSEKLKEVVPSEYFKKGEILYFPGCKTIKYFPENIETVIKFFEKFNIEFYIPDEIFCCGVLNINLGDIKGFKNLFEENIRKLKGVKTIISSCPECVYVFREKYRIKNVLHISEFLFDICVKDGIRSYKEITPVMFSDPCYLSKYLKIVDIPRNILSWICNTKVVEFLWSKERGRCCGGVLDFIKPSLAEKIATQKIQEAKEKKQNTIITSCPQCQHLLTKVSDNIKIEDIAGFLLERIS